jgi:hypothetical protein
MPKGWWRARDLGKAWYPTLADLAVKVASGEDEDFD